MGAEGKELRDASRGGNAKSCGLVEWEGYRKGWEVRGEGEEELMHVCTIVGLHRSG